MDNMDNMDNIDNTVINTNIDTNNNDDNSDNDNTNKKILGRFENHKELEKAYRELETSYSKKQNWEKKYNEDLNIPENYLKSDDISDIDDDFLQSISDNAKKLNLNQSQFVKYAQELHNKNLEIQKQKESEKVTLDDNLATYLKNELGLTEHIISSLNKEDVKVYENKLQESLNTNSSVNNSYHTINTNTSRKKAYRELKNAELTGDRALIDEKFDIWNKLT